MIKLQAVSLIAVFFMKGALADPRFSLKDQIKRIRSSVEYSHPKMEHGKFFQDSGISDEDNFYTRKIVKAHAAWKITEGSPDVIVAVIDSGIELTHPDLKSNLWVNTAEANGTKGVDDDRNGYIDDVHGWDFVLNQPIKYDGTGHGTHCAGNVAASRNNIGVVGVAPQVKIMPVRFINSNGSGQTEGAIRAIEYAVQNGAKILSNSWGGGEYDEPLESAIQEVQKAGVIFVASANNNGRNIDISPSYPASYSGVIAVGNSDQDDKKNSRSNYGKKSVFIFAPGTDSLSTYWGGGYRALSGTSMSAPQVAGAFALAKSLRPTANIESLKSAMCVGADKVVTTYSKCGRLNLESLLQNLLKL